MKHFYLFFFLLLIGMCLPSFSVQGQVTAISGVVKDDKNEILVGVTIINLQSKKGTVTNADGSYTLEAKKGDPVRFSYIGMETQTITVGNTSVINVTISASEVLEEVVVVGYGTQKKESVVGAIVQTKGADLKQRMAGSDIANSLTGTLPGLVTLRSSGIPGGSGIDDSGTQIFIRGRSTWNGGQPLILVDGVERSFNDIDPDQVETVSILKDASATAVFGVKGANGVILVTTKRGKEGKPVFSVETSVSFSKLSRNYGILNSYDARTVKNMGILHEVALKESSWQQYTPNRILEYYRTQQYPELFPDVNWQKEITNPHAVSNRVSLNLSGGTKFVKYFSTLSYLHEGDILKTQDFGQGYDPNFSYKRYNFRTNLDFNITRTTTFSVNLAGYYGNQQRPAGDRFNFWKGFSGQPPDLTPVRYSDGVWGDYSSFDRYPNSVAALNFSGITRANRTEVNTDFILNQKLDFITKGLSFNGRLAYDNRFITIGSNISDDGVLRKWIDPKVIEEIKPGMSGAELQSIYNRYTFYTYPSNYTQTTHGFEYRDLPYTHSNEQADNGIDRALFYQLSINYGRSFGNHNVEALALLNRRENATGSNFVNYREDWVARITYNWKERYFMEFNGAYNGSEKFASKYRYGLFPSLALGWVLSNEPFFEKLTQVVNLVKFRYSFGKVGSDDGVPKWGYADSYNVQSTTWPFGSPATQPGQPWRSEGTIGNPDLHWETAQKQNIGMEVALLRNKITFNADYFWEHRTDIFLSAGQRKIPALFGAPAVGINAGETRSWGYETEAKYNLTALGGNLTYTLSANFSHAIDKIIYREDPELAPEYQKLAGFQIGQGRSQINQPGFIQSWDQLYTGVMSLDNTQRLPGDFRQVDFNADGYIDNKDDVPYGYTDRPQYNYGLTNVIEYKGISLMVQLYGVFNVSGGINRGEFPETYSIVRPLHLYESWSPERGNTTSPNYPHVRFDTQSPKGEFWIEDRSYLKVQNAELAYKIKAPIVKRLGLSTARIALSGNNLAMISKMRDDRDRVPSDVDVNRSYPMMRRYTATLYLSF